MLRRIGGPHVDVQTLMGPGVDPHLFKPNPSDIRLIKNADAVFYNGLHLEGRMADMLAQLAERQPVVAVAARLHDELPEKLRKAAEFADAYDPHVWFDAALWAECADYAGQRLAEIDPDHADDYRRNAADYVESLRALDDWCREQLARIPPERRVLVTAHDAFGYFGRAYDVEVHGLQGISTVDEADLATVNELVNLLVSRGVKAVFVESSVPPKNIKSLVEGCEARGHTVAIGGELYSDALGPAESQAGTYEGMVRYNVAEIVKALQ